MLKEWVLGIGSLIGLGGEGVPSFNEALIDIPKGTIEITTPFDWNAVTFFHPEGKDLPAIYYESETGVFPWEYFEEFNGDHQKDALNLLFLDTPQKSIKIISDESVKVMAHFFNTHIEDENLTAKFDPIDSDSKTLFKKIKLPRFINRENWGANESLRTIETKRKIKNYGFTRAQEIQQLAPYFRPKVKETHNEHNQKLHWPLEENRVIKKFVIHHTGEVNTKNRNPKALMRAIYYFHTITRGWGDIGYHYVIDKQGNIYEGRAGGPTILGAHTALHNVASIGISLMGNFNHEEPTDAQIKILKILLADHANRFKVDPASKSSWLDTHSHNISGHRDLARRGYKTSCPGKNLQKRLSEIRKDVKTLAAQLRKPTKNGRDFLAKSKAAQKIQRRIKRKAPDPIILEQHIGKAVTRRGKFLSLSVELKNNTDDVWDIGEKLMVSTIPDGMVIKPFSLTSTTNPQETGVFKSRVLVSQSPNGLYNLELVPKIKDLKTDKKFVFPLQVSGNVDDLFRENIVYKKENNQFLSAAKKSSSVIRRFVEKEVDNGPDIKVKLSYFEEKYVFLEGSQEVDVLSNGKVVLTSPANNNITVTPLGEDQKFLVNLGEEKITIINPQFRTEGFLTIKNYDRGLGSVPYNKFRRKINVHSTDDGFYLVNELPLEEYLWGLSEEPSTEPDEKKHAIHILARSYGLVYSGSKRKFRTLHYDLEDSPKTSQFYLGYDWEIYHNYQKELVAETKGMVITYRGRPAIGPYFTQSGGESSSKWTGQYPWTRGRKLPFDEGLKPKGHGVGLSGNSARVLAYQGKNYEQILDYFFNGIETEVVY